MGVARAACAAAAMERRAVKQTIVFGNWQQLKPPDERRAENRAGDSKKPRGESYLSKPWHNAL